jgi:hypothetical protein
MRRDPGKERYKKAKERLGQLGILPRVRFDIDDDDPASGIKTISLVDKPAIESEFVVFSQAKDNLGNLRYQRAKHRMNKILKRK